MKKGRGHDSDHAKRGSPSLRHQTLALHPLADVNCGPPPARPNQVTLSGS